MYDLAGMAATALGVAHPAQRFFFRHVGHVFMLTHTNPAAEIGVRKLHEASADEELAEAPVVGRGEGFRPRMIARELLRSVLDHTHTSYGHDLLVAAKRALQQYGMDGVIGSPTALSLFHSVGGSAVPPGLNQGGMHRRSDVNILEKGLDRSTQSSVGSRESHSQEVVPWPGQPSLAAQAHSGADTSEPTSELPAVRADSVDDEVAAKPDVGRAAHVLALGSSRIPGVRIRNGVVWRPVNGAQTPVQVVGKNTVLSHRRLDYSPHKVTDHASRENNGVRACGALSDDFSLSTPSGKSSTCAVGTRAKHSMLSSDRFETGGDLDAL